MTIDEQKQALREKAQETRAAVARAVGPAGDALRDRFVETVAPGLDPGDAVSAFLPIGDEIDPRPLLAALEERGHPGALPVVVGKARPLVFRRWRDGDDLEKGGFGTRHPLSSATEIRPQVLLVPLLAFDRRGYRMGWGGGFYDRTLAGLRADGGRTLAVGVAYAGQEVDAVPRDDYDQPLDWVVTEEAAIRIDR